MPEGIPRLAEKSPSLVLRREALPKGETLGQIIEDFHNLGLVDHVNLTELISRLAELKYLEIGETIDSDRRSVEERLVSNHGDLLASLRPLTKKHVVDADLWSRPRLRSIEPILAPLNYALALESEFDDKIFQPNKSSLEELLRELHKDVPRPGQSCGLGQMQDLLRGLSSNRPGAKLIKDRLSDGNFLALPETLSVLEKLREHRNMITHRDKSGKGYSAKHCSQILERLLREGWIFRFLRAIQLRRADT